MLTFIFPFLFLLLSCTPSVYATCYWKDGTVAKAKDGLEFTACGGNAAMCCGSVGNHTDACTSQGLCQTNTGTLYRGACTDPTWASPSCHQFCPSVISDYAFLHGCTDGKFCCASDVTCCIKKRGLSVVVRDSPSTTTSSDPSTSTSDYSSPSPTSRSASDILRSPEGFWQFIVGNAWLATPIEALIGWVTTWLFTAILASNKGLDYGHVADRRYTGIIKRTCAAAFLADPTTGYPRQVIKLVSMDPGIASGLKTLEDLSASWFDYTTWSVELLTEIYAVGAAIYIWIQDDAIKSSSPWLQFQLLLSVLNINRGTWALAATGCFYPGTDKQRRKWLMGTTILALCIDWIFISRALEMAWHISLTRVPMWVVILSYLLPALEAMSFFIGLFAGYRKIEYIGPIFVPFLPIAFWLALGPFFIIIMALFIHFAPNFLLYYSHETTY